VVSKLGHKQLGRTIALHSVAVLPKYQGDQLGSTLLKAYIDRMKSAKVADRIALICLDRPVAFYTRLGFKYMGRSKATFGGETWNGKKEKLEGTRISNLIEYIGFRIRLSRTPVAVQI
jgi:GNAT superfamily N-acetyltransferase